MRSEVSSLFLQLCDLFQSCFYELFHIEYGETLGSNALTLDHLIVFLQPDGDILEDTLLLTVHILNELIHLLDDLLLDTRCPTHATPQGLLQHLNNILYKTLHVIVGLVGLQIEK